MAPFYGLLYVRRELISHIILRFCYFVCLQVWKTLEMTDRTLMDMIVGKDYDVTELFQEEWQPPKSPLERDKRRGGRLETEEFYLSVCGSFNICTDYRT